MKAVSQKIKLLNVIPITKSIFNASPISYFTAKDVGVGSLVSITLRNTKVPALVISVSELLDKKASLKSASFKLKSVSGIISKPFLTPNFINAVKKISRYYITSQGAILKQLIPERVLKKGSEVESLTYSETKTHFQYAFIQAEQRERVKHYKSIVRESFARNESVFLLLPTIKEVDDMYKEISKGIEDRTIIIHSKLKAKDFDLQYKKALTEERPVLIVGTYMCLFIARCDLGVIIVDHESSSVYKRPERPFMDIRHFAETLTKEFGAKFIVGDIVLSTEAYFKATREPSTATSRSNFRIESSSSNIIFHNETKKHNFSSIGEELKNYLKKSIKQSDKTVLFVSRKGVSPMTICQDCSDVISCPNCLSPLVLYTKRGNQHQFLCNACFSETKLNDRCPKCKGWRLKSYGIGAQKVEEEIRQSFPEANIFRLDSDIARTQKQGQIIVNHFKDSKNSILITTELFFSFFTKPLDNIFVISVDNLFTIPDFKMSEKIFRTLLILRSMTNNIFGIQTRIPSNKIFEQVLSGSLTGFYREDLEIRQKLEYPPFKLLIKISKKDKDKQALEKDIAILKNKLAQYQPLDFPAFIAKIKNIHIHHILLKIEPNSWPQEQSELEEILTTLGPAWTIQVDPDTIL